MSVIHKKLVSLPTRSRAADRIAALLAGLRVDTVFGIPGGTISPLNDALLDHPSVRVFIARHESEAVFAACGHALAGGGAGVGVVFVTSGPGLTNALTGLASAKCDRVPLVLLAGEVARSAQGKGALQDGSAHGLDVRSVARSLCKAVLEIAEPRTAALRVADALRLARDGIPGPVMVTLPLDVLLAEVPPCESYFAERDVTYSYSADLLEGIHARLVDEPRPLLYAGAGCRAPLGGGGDTPALLRAFAERYRLPVVTSPKAKGVFPEDHPLALGVFGLGGHPSAARYVESGVGTLLVIGSGLGDLATEGSHPALQPERALIHVDVDAGAIGRSYRADVAVVGPAGPFLESMLAQPMSEAPVRPQRRFGVVKHEPGATAASAAPQARPAHTPHQLIAPGRAIEELQRALPPETRFVVDSGEHFLFASHYLKLTLPDQFIALTGLGAMGSSIGVAIGAQLAEPDRPTCVIIGDGGMSMVGLELLDAVAHKAPLVVAMINDGRLGMCALGHQSVYGRAPDYTVPQLDIGAFAAAVGARGHVVYHAGDIDALAPALRGPTRPILLDVRVDASVALPKRDRIGAMGKHFTHVVSAA